MADEMSSVHTVQNAVNQLAAQNNERPQASRHRCRTEQARTCPFCR